jgi:hypothetical protein
MITVVYFEDIDGYKVVVAAFLMQYDAKVFIEADKSFTKSLEMQELTLDAWQGWEVIKYKTTLEFPHMLIGNRQTKQKDPQEITHEQLHHRYD